MNPYHFVNSCFVGIGRDEEFFSEKLAEVSADVRELIDLHAGGCIGDGAEVLVHILGWPELLDGLQAPIELVAKNGDDVIAWHHPFIVDEGLSLLSSVLEFRSYPDLSVDLVARLEMLRDVVLLLSDCSKLLASVDAYPAH